MRTGEAVKYLPRQKRMTGNRECRAYSPLAKANIWVRFARKRRPARAFAYIGVSF
jgi:hypothetical protein